MKPIHSKLNLIALILTLLVLAACGGTDPTPPAGTPAAPTNVTATPGPGYITVAWQDNSDNETGFVVFRNTVASNAVTTQQSGTKVGEVGAGEEKFIDQSIEVGQNYRYSVAAMNAEGSSQPAAPSGGGGVTVEEGISLVVASFNIATLEQPWTSFLIYFVADKELSNETATIEITGPVGWNGGEVGVIDQFFNDVSVGWTIRSIGAEPVVGEYQAKVTVGDDTYTATASLDSLDQLPTPQNVEVTSATASEVTASWDAVPGAKSYFVMIRADDLSPTVDGVYTETTSHTFSSLSLEPGDYIFEVIAYDFEIPDGGQVIPEKPAGFRGSYNSAAFTIEGGSSSTTWRYLSTSDPLTLDPARAYDTASSLILENVYETLYTYEGESLELVPGLATDFNVSADGRVYTLTLREGVTFHSGNALTCADVEYSLERGLVTAHPDGAVSYLVGQQFLGTQLNGADSAAYQAAVDFATIDDAIECLGGLTVQLTLTEADPAILARLSYATFSIVDSKWAINNGMWDGTEATWTDWIGRDLTAEFMDEHASGTGAYRLVSTEQGLTVVESFADYWGGAAQIDTVEVITETDYDARVAALLDGTADYAGVRSADVAGSAAVQVWQDPAWSSASVGLFFFNQAINMTDNPDIGSGTLDGAGIPANFFADINVRKCLAYSFDQDAFIDAVYGGEGVKLTMAVPPSFSGYDSSLPIYDLDPAAAEAACRAAFGGTLWDTGFEFTALYNSGNNTRLAVLKNIQVNLQNLNPKFVMNIRDTSFGDVLDHIFSGKGTIAVVGWAADYADAENFTSTFYASDGFYSGVTHFADAQIDDLLEQAQNTTDPTARANLFAQVGARGVELVPFVPYPRRRVSLVTSAATTGVYYNSMLSGNFLWKDISKAP